MRIPSSLHGWLQVTSLSMKHTVWILKSLPTSPPQSTHNTFPPMRARGPKTIVLPAIEVGPCAKHFPHAHARPSARTSVPAGQKMGLAYAHSEMSKKRPHEHIYLLREYLRLARDRAISRRCPGECLPHAALHTYSSVEKLGIKE